MGQWYLTTHTLGNSTSALAKVVKCRMKLNISSTSNFIDSSGEMAMVWGKYLLVFDSYKDHASGYSGDLLYLLAGFLFTSWLQVGSGD